MEDMLQKISSFFRRAYEAATNTGSPSQSSVEAMVPPEDDNFVGAGDFLKTGQEFLGYFIERGELKPTDTVLDIGCGIGRMAVPLTPFLKPSARYEGIDIVPKGITWCQEQITSRHPNFHFQLADVYNKMYLPTGAYSASEYRFPYEDDTFDFIFLTSVFTHMLPPDLENYVREIGRVLRPGGRCLSTFFLMEKDALELMAAGESTLDFRQDLGTHRIVDPEMPELAVGYEAARLLALFEQGGMKIRMPVYYGNWPGRRGCINYQDMMVFVKQKI